MPEFEELRERIPVAWREALDGASTQAYLNARDMKEFSLEIPDIEA